MCQCQSEGQGQGASGKGQQNLKKRWCKTNWSLNGWSWKQCASPLIMWMKNCLKYLMLCCLRSGEDWEEKSRHDELRWCCVSSRMSILLFLLPSPAATSAAWKCLTDVAISAVSSELWDVIFLLQGRECEVPLRSEPTKWKNSQGWPRRGWSWKSAAVEGPRRKCGWESTEWLLNQTCTRTTRTTEQLRSDLQCGRDILWGNMTNTTKSCAFWELNGPGYPARCAVGRAWQQNRTPKDWVVRAWLKLRVLPSQERERSVLWQLLEEILKLFEVASCFYGLQENIYVRTSCTDSKFWLLTRQFLTWRWHGFWMFLETHIRLVCLSAIIGPMCVAGLPLLASLFAAVFDITVAQTVFRPGSTNWQICNIFANHKRILCILATPLSSYTPRPHRRILMPWKPFSFVCSRCVFLLHLWWLSMRPLDPW